MRQLLKDKHGAMYIRACVILIILSLVFMALFAYSMTVLMAKAQRKGAIQTLDAYTQTNAIDIYNSIKVHSDTTDLLDPEAYIANLCVVQGLVKEGDDYVAYDDDGYYRYGLSDITMSFVIENTTFVYVEYNLKIPFRFAGTVTWLDIPLVISSRLKPIFETEEDTMVNYTVNHWKYDLDGNPVLDRSWTLRAAEGDSVTPPTIAYPGFIAPVVQTVTVSADKTTVVDYYYSRETYTVEITAGEGIASVSGAGTYQYGQTVTISVVLSDGYTIPAWSGDTQVLTGGVNELTYNFIVHDDVELTVVGQQ